MRCGANAVCSAFSILAQSDFFHSASKLADKRHGHAGCIEFFEPLVNILLGGHAYLDQPRHNGVGHKIDDAVFYWFLLCHDKSNVTFYFQFIEAHAGDVHIHGHKLLDVFIQLFLGEEGGEVSAVAFFCVAVGYDAL